jgi:hypothetical protein
MSKPNIICLTPIKNEAWILHRFLKCTSLWADHIIILDQQSDDGSREIACSYPKVKLLDNPSTSYNEPERQKLLIEAAREIPEPRLLIALDADEFLSANFMDSPEWKTILSAPRGTAFDFFRAEVVDNMTNYWLSSTYVTSGFVDDGSEHSGQIIHSPRLPVAASAPRVILQTIKVLHYQYTDLERLRSKHRWYQCWERLNQSHRHAVDIFRQYHHMLYRHNQFPLPHCWLYGYEKNGIDMTSVSHDSVYWWDKEILDLMSKYGAKMFRKEAVWDIDWCSTSHKIGLKDLENAYQDPRNFLEKIIHRYLRRTQPFAYKRTVKIFDKLLKLIGW